MRSDEIDEVDEKDLLLKTSSALGHGIMSDLHHVIYVKSDGFLSSNNSLIAREIEKINKTFLERGENYILIGPGRWGSSDTALGIPVKWPHISAARLIVETALSNYFIEPSQGTTLLPEPDLFRRRLLHAQSANQRLSLRRKFPRSPRGRTRDAIPEGRTIRTAAYRKNQRKKKRRLVTTLRNITVKPLRYELCKIDTATMARPES